MKVKSKHIWLFSLIIGMSFFVTALTLQAQGPMVFATGSYGADPGVSAEPGFQNLYRDPERLILENEYIAVAVNNSTDATGRFGIKVTGGDPPDRRRGETINLWL